jgi:predicted DNA-binding helix-hairpin-helix protein
LRHRALDLFARRGEDNDRIMMAAIAAIALSATALSAQTKAPVNLNTATAGQLATTPGVGAKMAERIIDYWQKNGGFKKRFPRVALPVRRTLPAFTDETLVSTDSPL